VAGTTRGASYHPVAEPGQDGDPELDRQRAEIEDAFRELWVPPRADAPQVLTERVYAAARSVRGPAASSMKPNLNGRAGDDK
jgi:hypothetical protein